MEKSWKKETYFKKLLKEGKKWKRRIFIAKKGKNKIVIKESR